MVRGAAVGFELEVVDSFTIAGRGTFVTGPWSGRLPIVGDALMLRRGELGFEARCVGVGFMRKLDADGQVIVPDPVGVGVEVVGSSPAPGDRLVQE